MTTYIRKDIRNNWKAWTDVDLSPTLRLKVSTYKVESGAVVTTATVSKVESSWETHTMYQDFSKRLESVKYPRVTSKVIETQHAKHDIQSLIEEAKTFYKL
jgi:hypothetical protein